VVGFFSAMTTEFIVNIGTQGAGWLARFLGGTLVAFIAGFIIGFVASLIGQKLAGGGVSIVSALFSGFIATPQASFRHCLFCLAGTCAIRGFNVQY
jgi:hypothetical protein